MNRAKERAEGELNWLHNLPGVQGWFQQTYLALSACTRTPRTRTGHLEHRVGWCTSLDSGYVLYPVFRGPFEIRVRNPGDFAYFILFGYSIFLILVKKTNHPMQAVLLKNRRKSQFRLFGLVGRRDFSISQTIGLFFQISKSHPYPQGQKLGIRISFYF